ncbi:putative methyltransferase [Poriferisphaera corsica]|uniref:site-specific DNA-methyltransferase (adenine-specific) n=1 Tax=Poriferisphaera corsica TaxID=2528020 RepID=A0A517YT88_9BACT|nr:DNA methyltransferase [Poriferisphaera corsica]QDU33436.1 putative methyltransferase [Poriferisphaera corsica]
MKDHRSNKQFRPRKPQGSYKQSQPQQFRKPPLRIQPTTLWDYPSQHYGDDVQGDPNYRGATPSYVIWNLLQRYTQEGDLVVDPCCGSGTTLDVAKDLGRNAMGFDVNPTREDITNADARDLPVKNGEVDFVFIDPPYSTHLEYSDDVRCIGKLDAADGSYYEAMDLVLEEINRVLKPGGFLGLYVSDSYVHRGLGKGFHAIGFELFDQMRAMFTPIDIVSVVRHNRTLEMGNYRASAEEENFYLRGFNYLFVMQKPGGEHEGPRPLRAPKQAKPDRRGEGKKWEGKKQYSKKVAKRDAFIGKGKKAAKRQRERGQGPEFHGSGEKIYGGKKRTFRVEGGGPTDMPAKKKRWNKKGPRGKNDS